MPGLGLAGDAEADDRRQQHGERLAEHGRLGLDAADAPAEHAEAVDHGRVRVGADQGVAEGPAVVGGEDEARQVLEVHLVADAHAGRHGAEAAGRRPGPSAGAGSAPCCAGTRWRRWCRRPTASPDRSTMTEWSMTSSTGTSGLTCAASPPRRASASRMAARSTTPGTPVKSCMSTRSGVRAISCAASPAPCPWPSGFVAPGGHGHDVVGRDVGTVLVAQQVLEDDLDGVGEALDVVAVGERRRLDVEDLVGALADGQLCPGAEGVGVRCGRGVRAHAPILPWAGGGRPSSAARRGSAGPMCGRHPC